MTLFINQLSHYYNSYLYSSLGYKKLAQLDRSDPKAELSPPPKAPDSNPKWFERKKKVILVCVYTLNIMWSLALLFLWDRLRDIMLMMFEQNKSFQDIEVRKFFFGSLYFCVNYM